MQIQKRKIEKVFRAVRIAKAVTTLAVIAVPVATTVGMIAGYGAYSLLRRMRKAK
jgi:hypothetical protein